MPERLDTKYTERFTMSLASEEKSNNMSSNQILLENEDSSDDCKMIKNEREEEYLDPIVASKRRRTLHIALPFIPEQTHMFETCLSRPPNDIVKEQIDKCGVKMKDGLYNPSEDKILIKNWESLSKEYKIYDPSLFFSLKGMKLRERVKFAQYLGHNLPHRYLHSILMRFINLYSFKNTGKFSEDEDKILLKHMKKYYVANYIKLSRKLHRDTHSIYRRCQLLKKNIVYSDFNTNLKWNKELVEKLLRSMLNVFKIDDITLLKNKFIPFSSWCQIEKDCSIPARQAKKYWLRKLYVQLFAVNRITRNEISIKLIDIFLEKNYRYREDIKWNEICTYFNDDGITSLFLSYMWWMLVKRFVPKEIVQQKFKKAVRLLKSYESKIRSTKNYALEKLTFTKSEGLKIVQEDK